MRIFWRPRRDAALEKRLDGYIERIAAAAAKDPDGYLNTWTQLMAPDQRWGLNGGNDVQQHDVYNASAMIEAAVHYYRATGKTRLLAVATRLANHMADVMGPPPKQNVVPGHSLGEEALVKLYLLFREKPELKSRMPVPVDEQRYLGLAEFWIENRGNHQGRPSYGTYAQDHKPVLQQDTIEGHAVRATLLCAGLAAAGNVNGRNDYLTAAHRLWNNMVHRRMYIIGGLGAVAGVEGFGADYVLPNNGYLETCAAIGAGFFHNNMNLAFADARYADELERVLYNGILSGVSLKGDTYFYENPLQAGQEPEALGVAWLPVLSADVPEDHGRPAWLHLCPGTRRRLRESVHRQPRDPERPGRQGHAPADDPLSVGWRGQAVRRAGAGDGVCRERSFARLVRRTSIAGERQPDGELRETPRLRPSPANVAARRCHRAVAADARATHQGPSQGRGRQGTRGAPARTPCLLPRSGGQQWSCAKPGHHSRSAAWCPPPGRLGGRRDGHQGPCLALQRVEWPDALYLPSTSVPGVTDAEFTAIPYFANANREPGEMMVWMAETASQAEPVPTPALASRARPSASHCWQHDALSGLNDQIEPAASDDTKIPRFTWWDHRGTREWVQYDFERPEKVSAVAVYWWDERRIGAHCRVPQSWRLLYQSGGEWMPVPGASAYGKELDGFNRVTFAGVETRALRLEVQLQAGWSGGILEWKVE